MNFYQNLKLLLLVLKAMLILCIHKLYIDNAINKEVQLIGKTYMDYKSKMK